MDTPQTDELDGCDLDFSVEPVPDDEVWLWVLSPDGELEKLVEYRELFGATPTVDS